MWRSRILEAVSFWTRGDLAAERMFTSLMHNSTPHLSSLFHASLSRTIRFFWRWCWGKTQLHIRAFRPVDGERPRLPLTQRIYPLAPRESHFSLRTGANGSGSERGGVNLSQLAGVIRRASLLVQVSRLTGLISFSCFSPLIIGSERWHDSLPSCMSCTLPCVRPW